MSNKDTKPQNVSISPEKLGFVKSQLEQAFETFRVQFSLLTQVASVLVLADVTVIGYAISTKNAGILLIGALFPIIIRRVAQFASKLMLPVIYSAVSLETKYGGAGEDWLASTFLGVLSIEYIEELKSISTIQDTHQRMAKLRLSPLILFGKGSKTRLILLLVTLSQIIAPVVLFLFFNWQLF